MLMTIRDKAQGWIAWLIVILISVPFALWGIQEYLGVGSEPLIAKVNEREITQSEVEKAAFRLRNELRQRLGTQYKAELFEEAALRKQVLDSMIRDTLIQQAADDLGLRAGDFMVQQTIASIPAFQVNGAFDQAAYKRSVQLQGLSEQGFEERLRNTLMTRQLELALQGSAFVTNDFAADAEKLAAQKRKVSYIMFSTDQVDKSIPPSDDQISQYYQSNSLAFMSPERVKLDYLVLNLDTIARTLNASDEELMSYYQAHKSEFVAPEKKRISHILLEANDEMSADELSAVEQQARALLSELQSGAEFADLAKQHSQDIATAGSGGDLGMFELGIFDKAFENAVSSLQMGQVSEPVRTRFGYHLIQATEVIKGGQDDFDAVKQQVREQYLNTEAEQIYFDYAERLANLSYETPDSLVPASEELGLKIQQSDWLTRDGAEGIFASGKVMGAAFSEEAITQGFNSEALEISPTEMVILRVAEHQETSLKPLDSVKAEIIEMLKDETAFKTVEAQATELLEKARQGTALEEIAEQSGLTLKTVELQNRASTDAPFAVVNEVYKMSRPKQAEQTFATTTVSDKEVALMRLDAVVDGDGQQLSDEAIAMLASQQATDEFNLYVESLKANAQIEYFNN